MTTGGSEEDDPAEDNGPVSIRFGHESENVALILEAAGFVPGVSWMGGDDWVTPNGTKLEKVRTESYAAARIEGKATMSKVDLVLDIAEKSAGMLHEFTARGGMISIYVTIISETGICLDQKLIRRLADLNFDFELDNFVDWVKYKALLPGTNGAREVTTDELEEDDPADYNAPVSIRFGHESENVALILEAAGFVPGVSLMGGDGRITPNGTKLKRVKTESYAAAQMEGEDTRSKIESVLDIAEQSAEVLQGFAARAGIMSIYVMLSSGSSITLDQDLIQRLAKSNFSLELETYINWQKYK